MKKAILVVLLLASALVLFGCTVPNAPVCGNNICESPVETAYTCSADCGQATTCSNYLDCGSMESCTNLVNSQMYCEKVSIDSALVGPWFFKTTDGLGISRASVTFYADGAMTVKGVDSGGNVINTKTSYTAGNGILKMSAGSGVNAAPFGEMKYTVLGTVLTLNSSGRDTNLYQDESIFCGDGICDEYFDENALCPADCGAQITN